MERIYNKIDKILELMSKGSEEIESLRLIASLAAAHSSCE